LTKPINALNKLHKRHEVIRALTTALLEERVGQPKQDVDVKVEWLASTVDELLTASDALEADDAKVILEMLNAPRLPNSFFDR
jgi:hydroxypyruvate isomerase